MATALLFSQMALGLTLLVAASTKLFNFRSFADNLSKSNVPARLQRPVAGTVLSLELGVVLTMFVDQMAMIGFILAMSLLICFSGVLVIAIRRRDGAACRCFGRPTPV